MSKYQLREYYIAYLKNVRFVSDSSVNHYLQAIERISKFLSGNHLITNSLFEIDSLESIEELKLYLTTEYKPNLYIFNPIELRELDARGNRMYINGFMHYYNFAIGYDFAKNDQIKILDMPMPVAKEKTIVINQIQRNSILKKQVIEAANYSCEINFSHQTFNKRKTDHPYMEAHHLIPLSQQNNFHNTSLDVYANIMCLCPNCHRFLHYGNDKDRAETLKIIFSKRADRLLKSGIKIDQTQFLNKAII